MELQQTLLRLGQYWEGLERWEPAIEAYQRALDLTPASESRRGRSASPASGAGDTRKPSRLSGLGASPAAPVVSRRRSATHASPDLYVFAGGRALGTEIAIAVGGSTMTAVKQQ